MSYLLSCSLSQQTLAEYDEGYVLLLVENKRIEETITLTRKDGTSIEHKSESSVATRPSHFWHPYSLALRVSFGDAGQVDLIHTTENKKKALACLHALVQKSYDFVATDRSSASFSIEHEVNNNYPKIKAVLEELSSFFGLIGTPLDELVEAVEFDDLSSIYKAIFGAVQRGELFVDSFLASNQPLPISCAMIHANSYRIAKETLSEQSFLGQMLTEDVLFTQTLKEESFSTISFEAFEDKATRRGLQRDNKLTRFWSSVLRRVELNPIYLPHIYLKLFSSEKGLNNPEEWQKQIAPILSDLHLFQAMDQMHIPFAPSRYAGQDYGNDIGVSYSRFVGSCEQAITPQYEEEDMLLEKQGFGS